MLNHSLSSLLHGYFFPRILGFTLLRLAQRIKKMHGYQRATLLARVPRERLAAIFKAEHRFQALNLRLLKINCNKTQLYDQPLSSSTFYQCSGWHLYSGPDAVGIPPPWDGGGLGFGDKFLEGWIWDTLSLLHSQEHCVPRMAQVHEKGTVGGWCTRRSGGCSTKPTAHSPLCLQTFPYPQRHERGAVTGTKHQNLARNTAEKLLAVFIGN